MAVSFMSHLAAPGVPQPSHAMVRKIWPNSTFANDNCYFYCRYPWCCELVVEGDNLDRSYVRCNICTMQPGYVETATFNRIDNDKTTHYHYAADIRLTTRHHNTIYNLDAQPRKSLAVRTDYET